jgi:beta-lactamase class A
VSVLPDTSRRRFLAAFALAGGTAALGLPGASAAAKRSSPRRSPDLAERVAAHIRTFRRQGVIEPDEVTAWSVYDFTTRHKLVAINEDIPLQAASMIKPFVVLAFFYQVHSKSSGVRYTRQVRRRMEAMIRDSDNAATDRIIHVLGGPARVERILKQQAPGIFRQTRIVERIPPDGRSYRNLASAHDYNRFLYALWTDALPHSAEIKRLMHLPNRDRIYTGTQGLPRGTRVYDKTGTTARLCGDMGILVPQGRDGRNYPYTFIGIVQKQRSASDYGTWMGSRGDAIRSTSDLVYTWLREVHGLR